MRKLILILIILVNIVNANDNINIVKNSKIDGSKFTFGELLKKCNHISKIKWENDKYQGKEYVTLTFYDKVYEHIIKKLHFENLAKEYNTEMGRYIDSIRDLRREYIYEIHTNSSNKFSLKNNTLLIEFRNKDPRLKQMLNSPYNEQALIFSKTRLLEINIPPSETKLYLSSIIKNDELILNPNYDYLVDFMKKVKEQYMKIIKKELDEKKS